MDKKIIDGEPFWKQNLWVVWICQFVTYVGFSVAVPFTPFYMREGLGVADGDMLKVYVGLSSALPHLTLATMAPIWGVLADKFGRKIMMLRANILGGLIIGSMGLAPQIHQLLVKLGIDSIEPVHVFLFLRLLQGLFTGTTSAAMTLVSSCTPRAKQGYALAMISVSLFAGDIAGTVLGGYLSEEVGYQKLFMMTGTLWIVSGIALMLFTKENFQRPVKIKSDSSTSPFITVFLPALPLFAIYIISNMARFVDNSQLPLVIEFLNGGEDMPHAARWTSLVMAGGFIGAMLSGFILGRFIDKHALLISLSACTAAGFFLLAILGLLSMDHLQHYRVHLNIPGFPPDGSAAVYVMLLIRPFLIFCSAVLEPVWNSWLAKLTPPSSKGLMFGSAVTFRSVGQIITHSLASALALHYGFKAIYIAGPMLFFGLIPIVIIVEKKLHHKLV